MKSSHPAPRSQNTLCKTASLDSSTPASVCRHQLHGTGNASRRGWSHSSAVKVKCPSCTPFIISRAHTLLSLMLKSVASNTSRESLGKEFLKPVHQRCEMSNQFTWPVDLFFGFIHPSLPKSAFLLLQGSGARQEKQAHRSRW